MTPQQRRTLKARLRDARWYVERFLWIKTKDSQIVPLKFGATQAYYYERYWKPDRDALKPIRHFILKGRQTWITTGVSSLMFHDTATRKNRSTLQVSFDEDSTSHIFDMDKLFMDQLPPVLRPMQRYSNRRELVFENPSATERPEHPGLRSKITVATANNLKAGRSKTIQNVHLSEVAFYRALKAMLVGLLQSVPYRPDTAVVMETTADAVGSDAHALWEASKRGETAFTPIFIPWFVHEEYKLPFTSEAEQQRFVEGLTIEEREAQQLYGLTPEQLHWRRTKVKEFDDQSEFFKEYPENDVDCWLSSGSHALPVKDIQAMQKTAKPPKWRGYLETYLDERDPQNPVEKIRFVEDSKGPLSIWKLPQAGRQYALGSDTSEGITGGDYSVVDVVDKETSEQVAQWHGLIDPDLLGSDVIPNLGWFYNTADAGVERNNDGKTVLVALRDSGYPRVFRSVQVDERTNKQQKKLGWLTTRQSKPLLVNEIRQRLRERSVIINSPDTLQECLTFVRLPDGSIGAQANCKDDRVMSMGVVLQVLKHHPFVAPQKPRKRTTLIHADSVTGY